MGSYSGYYTGEKKKKKKEILEKEAEQIKKMFVPPKVEILGKKGRSK